MTEQLPANMQNKIAMELSPVSGLEGFCWTWTGCINSKGYGCVGVNGKSQLTHRVSYTLLIGPIPDGLQIDHLCTNKRCCNPAHLEAVTGKVNAGRTWTATKTVCVKGHPLSGENLIIKKRGNRTPVRNCRICTNSARKAKRDSRVMAA